MIDTSIILAIDAENAKSEEVTEYAETLRIFLDNPDSPRHPDYYIAKQHLNRCYNYLTVIEQLEKNPVEDKSKKSFPRRLQIPIEELEKKLRNLSYQNLTEDKLEGALIYLADEVGTTLYNLKKYYESIKNVEDREEHLSATKSELELILKLEARKLKLNEFLPPQIAQETMKLASKVKVSPEACLTTLITAISTCCKVGTQLEINLSQGFVVSPYQFSMIVAESGSMKSFIYDTFAQDPLAALQQSLDAGRKIEVAQYQEKIEFWDSLTPEERAHEFPEGKPELIDRPKVLYVGEKTIEGILTQFNRYPDQPIAYMKDELAGLFLDADKYKSGKGSESQTLMSMHGGNCPSVLTKSGGLESNSGKIGLNIFGTIQPEVLQEFWSEKVIDPDGYWSRFLYCYQPKTKKEIELERSGEPSPLPELLASLFRAVYALPAISYELCNEGYKTYAVFYNFLAATGHNEVHPAMSKAYSKALGLTGRLILILHIIDQVVRGKELTPTKVVPLDTVMKGINLMEFFIEQRILLHKKLCNEDSISPELKAILDASKRLGWVTARMIKRNIWQLRDTEPNKIRFWFQELADLGYGEIQGKGNRLKYSAQNPNPRQLDPENR